MSEPLGSVMSDALIVDGREINYISKSNEQAQGARLLKHIEQMGLKESILPQAVDVLNRLPTIKYKERKAVYLAARIAGIEVERSRIAKTNGERQTFVLSAAKAALDAGIELKRPDLKRHLFNYLDSRVIPRECYAEIIAATHQARKHFGGWGEPTIYAVITYALLKETKYALTQEEAADAFGICLFTLRTRYRDFKIELMNEREPPSPPREPADSPALPISSERDQADTVSLEGIGNINIASRKSIWRM